MSERSTRRLVASGAAVGVLATLVPTPAFAAAVPDVYVTYDPSVCSGPCSDAPYTNDDYADVESGHDVTIDVLANDVDQNPGVLIGLRPLSVAGVGNVTGWDDTLAELSDVGDFDVVEDKVVYSAPVLRDDVQDAWVEFLYVAQDLDGDRSVGAGHIHITRTAATLSVEPDTLSVPFGSSGSVDVVFNDSASDSSPLTVLAAGQGAHGSTQLVNGVVRYTPDTGFVGTDSFTYQVRSATGATGSGVVNVVVTAPGEPSAAADIAHVDYADVVDVDVLANDTSPTGPLTIRGVSVAAHGTVQVVNSMVRYTPAPGFAGTDTFTYTAADSLDRQVSARVDVEVALPDGPDVTGDTLRTAYQTPGTVDVLANDVSPVGVDLHLVSVTNGLHGRVSVHEGAVTYTPYDGFSGEDSFTYQVADTFGTTSTGTVDVIVDAAPATSTPTAPPTSTPTAPPTPPPAPTAATAPVTNLPQTGAQVGAATGVGAALLVVGGALISWAHRPRRMPRHRA